MEDSRLDSAQFGDESATLTGSRGGDDRQQPVRRLGQSRDGPVAPDEEEQRRDEETGPATRRIVRAAA